MEPREKVALANNLPKVPASKQIALLRTINEDNNDAKEKTEKYIPIEKQESIRKISHFSIGTMMVCWTRMS